MLTVKVNNMRKQRIRGSNLKQMLSKLGKRMRRKRPQALQGKVVTRKVLNPPRASERPAAAAAGLLRGMKSSKFVQETGKACDWANR